MSKFVGRPDYNVNNWDFEVALNVIDRQLIIIRSDGTSTRVTLPSDKFDELYNLGVHTCS